MRLVAPGLAWGAAGARIPSVSARRWWRRGWSLNEEERNPIMKDIAASI